MDVKEVEEVQEVKEKKLARSDTGCYSRIPILYLIYLLNLLCFIQKCAELSSAAWPSC